LLTLEHLAHILDGVGHGNVLHPISNLSSLSRAKEEDIVYFDNPLLKLDLQSTNAGIVLLKAEHLAWCPVNAIVLSDPLAAIKKVADLLPQTTKNVSLIDHSARIHPSAQLGDKVCIGAYAVIEAEAYIESDVTIGAHSIVGPSVHIGKRSYIDSHVTLHKGTKIGEEVRINSGCVVGSSPYNYVKEHGVWQQGLILGGVTLADQVHLGANTVIDQGAVGDTYLAKGVCVDNLVHVAHDVYIGANTAIAGSATIGAHVIMGTDCIIGGGSCIAAFVRLVDDVVISGMSTVSKSILKSGIYSSGTLAHEHQRWRKNAARFRRLDDYICKLSLLERKISGDD
jgi:UDP-3-O-[3-hydroxymyristoyl] glucosamine N-acyltransferase